jgi:hypothetical protein
MEDHAELEQIFAADQADRRGELPPDIIDRDRERLARVADLLDAGALRSAADHLRAAFIFQHGQRLEHYWQAHELALQAVDLGHGPPARWLAAAAYDRWLMHQGLPQKFGTQYRMAGARWVLHEVDPATSDAERARWEVPPLAVAEAHAGRLNERAAEVPRPAAAQDAPEGALASVALPGLRVALVAVAPAEAIFMPEAMPAPAPLDADELHPLPAELPPGLTPRRLGAGYCAVDDRGRLVASWFELLLPAGQTLHLAWNMDDGPPPALEVVDLSGRAAVFVAAAWSAVSLERLPLLAVRAGPDTCWLVGGRLGRAQLADLAAQLPWQGAEAM